MFSVRGEGIQMDPECWDAPNETMNLKHHTATNPTQDTQVSNVCNGKVGKETGSSTCVV